MTQLAFAPRLLAPLSTPRHPRLVPRKPISSPRSHRRRPAVVATLAFDSKTVTSFAEQIKGEWTGYEGNFSPHTGQPLPVPDYYIPEEFSEWGLTPLGFESNHSIIVRSDKLYRKFFRVLPSVSLFADHVDAEEDFRCDTIGDGLTIYSDGGFVNGKNKLPTKKSKLERPPRIEFRLPHPYQQKQAANVTLQLDFECANLVQDIRAVVEKWSCIYCDGADMDGSSGYIEGWVTGAPEGMTSRDDGSEVTRCSKENKREDGGRTARAAWRVRDRRVALQRIFDADGNVVNTERFVEQRQ
ncbi:hypothetical protein FGB62_29g215 [Gracilaria domingensis]|nr:hypothetical protein FGB62_29g215 [Gracilaria domingensis]